MTGVQTCALPIYGPLGGPELLTRMVDYLLIARQKVRTMLDQHVALADIKKQFNMNEFKGWDRESHFDWMAEELYRELQGMGPQIAKIEDATTSGKIDKILEEGRYLTVTTDGGKEMRLRVASDTNIEGIPDRSQFKIGMRFSEIGRAHV